MDVDAEREKITQEIQALERILGPGPSGFDEEVSESSLDSDSDAGDADSLPDEDAAAAGPPVSEGERWDGASNDEDDPKGKTLPEDPETCLQLNMVYQLVLQEKLAEVSLLLAQNQEQQEEVMWDLAGSKGPRVKDSKSLPLNLYVGHFLKPYFKDKVTGVGPPANEDAREKAGQGIKTFEELLVTKWKSWEKALLRKAVVSGRLQRLLQPKLLKLEYLQQKLSRATGEAERAALEEQSSKAEEEIRDINQLPEEALLGSRLDSHDWEKISNINFEGGRSAEEIRKFWQNWEHPSINKQEWTRPELEQLKAIAAKHGHLHWQEIAEELGTRRSAFQCLQQFQQHNKALRRRAWTEAEDRMLTQLVQEMRVGNHIPYRRIVYYMEGRDSMQLIYRWTKSLDPRLRKGLWTPEEDTKLLQAVAKYGEHDWFKIREEVPGRSDAQCRDRYLRRLHFSLKKGRWSPEEEEQLLELVEKHGVGHWEKIASELPHRTGSQCLSKWKIMGRGTRQGKRQWRRRRRRLRSVRWSSSSEASGSSGSSDGDSGDSEPEPEPEEALGPQEDGQSLPPAQHSVPDVDLWVPARQSAHTLGPGGCPGRSAASPGRPRASSAAPGGSRDVEETGRPAPSGTHSASLGGIGSPPCEDTRPTSSEGPANEGARRLLKVPLETLRYMLKTNMTVRGQAQKKPCLFGSPQGTTSGGSDGTVTRPHTGQLWRQHRRHALQQRRLGRQLLMAVSPWVGDDIVPCAPRRPTAAPTRADSIGAQLQDARLASTPVFTLLMQLFHTDTAGCMEVIRERKARLPPLPPAGAQAPSSAQSTPGHLPSQVTAQGAAAKRPRGAGGRGLQTCPPQDTPAAPPPAPGRPLHKVKTVFQLLREKRLREARASKAAQGPVVLPPQLLVSSPVILQPPLTLASCGPPATGPGVSKSALSGPGAPAATSPSAPGSGVTPTQPLALQALAWAPVPTVALQVPGGRQLDSRGPSPAPATSWGQGLPEAPALLPAAPSPAQPLIQSLRLTSAPGTLRGGPHVAASAPLPISSVLLPVPLPAVLGLPGPAATPDPQGLAVTLLPSVTETPGGQGHANRDAEPGPASRADLEALSPAPPPQIPAEAQPCQLPLPPGAGPGRTLLSPAEPGGTRAPLGLERPPPPQRGPEKDALDLSLLSQESEPAVQEWLRGLRGVCVPPLGSRLPYQPPALCSLQALSGLLLHKKALEHRAAALVPGGVAGTLQASRGWVQEQLQDSPAYLLLKARFLAAFTLPALLATLPPPGVRTTLSATRPTSGSEDEDLEELARSDGSRQPVRASSSAQAGSAAIPPVQGAPDPAPSCPDDLDDVDVLQTRHGRHARKRRRLL
ncbi:snRNA-activating protein complex subunit 4 isoform X2 [Myotis myotis]|uniref:snRNA-activating protein complex subunit 4 n=2 Tax=Myotis myotis TaxID=51298 RepID=A0A7J7QZD1_MYOMY|nr:snRNA-activating protein complex subunit 4 isoform X2 [Myotis myotis]XP_036162756.1 snRNA-activating protein complex subunit 4 isoform X2 [Myotis myotis]KAF6269143.1 small nuclear RNA activating complex polypeptide 4 [Myotis myotis]